MEHEIDNNFLYEYKRKAKFGDESVNLLIDLFDTGMVATVYSDGGHVLGRLAKTNNELVADIMKMYGYDQKKAESVSDE